jgi:hypothetical protein
VTIQTFVKPDTPDLHKLSTPVPNILFTFLTFTQQMGDKLRKLNAALYSSFKLFNIGMPLPTFLNIRHLRTVFYDTQTGTLRRVDHKYLESCEVWCWRRMEKISWSCRVRNGDCEDMLTKSQRGEEYPYLLSYLLHGAESFLRS